MSVILMATGSPGRLCAQSWVHPGIVVGQSRLEATRAAYEAGDPVIVSQVNKAMASSYGSLTYTVQGPWPGGTNQCGSYSTPNNGCSEADNDSAAAWVQALLWYITGDQTYAANAINILNTYSASFKGYAGTRGLTCPSGTDCSNGPLQSAWDAEKWPRAAEILRYGRTSGGQGSGWSSSAIAAFQRMLVDLYQPVVENGSGTNGNWDMSMIDATMQIAVFTENATLLADARSMWQGRVPDLYYLASVDGTTHAASPRGNPSWFGQVTFDASTTGVAQETCRDLTHTEDSISSTILAAETDWIQGGSLYQDAASDAEQRIVESINVMAGLESAGSGQNAFITAPAGYCTGSAATKTGHIELGAGDTYIIAYNHYHNRLNDPGLADGSGTGGLHGTANVYNWIQGSELAQADRGDGGNHMTLFEGLTHSVDLCRRVTSSWTNSSFAAQTGSFTATFYATPSGNDSNAVMGLSDGSQGAYPGLAAIVRFNPSGEIDAYNGTGYGAVSSIPYRGGAMYRFELDVNVAARTYSVWVTPVGGTRTLVGLNYAFRSTAASAVLNTLSLYAEVGTNNVCGLSAVTTNPSCTSVGSSWSNTSLTPEASTFTATLIATPSASAINSVMGLTDGPQGAYPELAAIARFNPSGYIDAYDGTGYQAAGSIPYSGGVPYAFEFVVNVPAQTYTVYVTPQGGTTTLVGRNYALRLSAPALTNLSLYAEVGANRVCSLEQTNH